MADQPMRFCIMCGKEFIEQRRFCQFCGAEFSEAELQGALREVEQAETVPEAELTETLDTTTEPDEAETAPDADPADAVPGVEASDVSGESEVSNIPPDAEPVEVEAPAAPAWKSSAAEQSAALIPPAAEAGTPAASRGKSPADEAGRAAGFAKAAERARPAAPAGPEEAEENGRDKSSVEEHRRHLAQFRSLMAAMWKEGRLTPEAERQLSTAARTLNITLEEEARIREQVLSGLEDVAGVDEEVEEEPGADVELLINNNQFYMEGHRCVIDLRLRNTMGRRLGTVRITAGGDLLQRPFSNRQSRLLARDEWDGSIQILPDGAGVWLLPISLTYEVDGAVKCFEARPVPRITVLGNQQSAQQIVINFDNSKHASEGSVIGGGELIDGPLRDAINTGRITTANDLLMQQLPERYEPLRLRFDYEAAEEARGRKESTTTIQRRYAPGHAPPAQPLRAISLCVAQGESERRIHLLSGTEIKLGRQRPPRLDNDVVIRPYPPRKKLPGSTDKLVAQLISQHHFTLTLTGDGLRLVPSASSIKKENTRVDEEVVRAEGCLLSASKRWTVNFGGAMSLAVLPFEIPGGKARRTDPYEDLMQTMPEAWKLAARAGLNCVRLVREDELRNLESYLLVFRTATIGSARGNPIQITDAGLSEVHAAIHHFDGCFWIEQLCPECPIKVGPTRLARGMLAPLVPGTPLEIAAARLQVRFFEQRFL